MKAVVPRKIMRPGVCGFWRVPCRTMPGQSARYDYEYERNGTCNLLMFFEPLRAWRHVDITDRRTGNDWAYAMKDLVDVYIPDAERIRVVMDNLNTHESTAHWRFTTADARIKPGRLYPSYSE